MAPPAKCGPVGRTGAPMLAEPPWVVIAEPPRVVIAVALWVTLAELRCLCRPQGAVGSERVAAARAVCLWAGAPAAELRAAPALWRLARAERPRCAKSKRGSVQQPLRACGEQMGRNGAARPRREWKVVTDVKPHGIFL